MTGLRHVQHCNVNCRDLDRSLEFYGSVVGLEPQVRTNPDPQSGAAFGIDGPAQWDAWMMSDGRPHPVVDLLEWKIPVPVGRPRGPAALGAVRLRFASPTTSRPTTLTDPDGTAIELVAGDGPRFEAVVVNVADIDASTAWYVDVLGLEVRSTSDRAVELGAPADPFAIELVAMPSPAGATAALEANHTGIYRIAFLVDDARAAHATLVAAGVDTGPPVWLDMGPTVPVDGLWAVFFRDPDGACLELIEVPAA